MLLIESPRESQRRYPDGGSSAEIYTNSDPLRYVELELLGPLEVLTPGETAQRVNTYTLLRRARSDPAADADRILGVGR